MSVMARRRERTKREQERSLDHRAHRGASASHSAYRQHAVIYTLVSVGAQTVIM